MIVALTNSVGYIGNYAKEHKKTVFTLSLAVTCLALAYLYSYEAQNAAPITESCEMAQKKLREIASGLKEDSWAKLIYDESGKERYFDCNYYFPFKSEQTAGGCISIRDLWGLKFSDIKKEVMWNILPSNNNLLNLLQNKFPNWNFDLKIKNLFLIMLKKSWGVATFFQMPTLDDKVLVSEYYFDNFTNAFHMQKLIELEFFQSIPSHSFT